MNNRPRGRQKHVTGAGKDVYKRGDGLGTGPVGRPQGYSGRGQSQQNYDTSSTPTRAGGRGGLLTIIIVAALAIFGGGGLGLSGLFGGSSNSSDGGLLQQLTQPAQQQQQQQQSPSMLEQLFGGSGTDSSSSGGLLSNLSSVTNGWSSSANTGKLNTKVAPEARPKRTNIIGNGQDTVTIMVYLCGTDLESKSGMGTADIQEMINAKISDNVNILLYTGGCKKWKNNIVSSSNNQIYKVESGGLRCLVNNDGSASMTKPSTLAGFIKYCAKNFPANRNELILWDHGGGSISGYGYDEKNAMSGSMTLKGLDEALSSAGMTFDFIGYDACLMGSLENALIMAPYADYLIASEETEPGVGWYYTNWLTALSRNTSMSTPEIGKNIIDDFVDTCAQRCRGQKATLSIIDLAELEKTVPQNFKDFSVSTSNLIQGKDFKKVSDARSSARAFAVSSKSDQVDLVDLAQNIGTDEAKALAKSLMSAVKYNRTSSDITNAYGVSIYFPYQKTSKVDSAVAAYDAIGLDSEYARCIQQFASLEVGGQAVSGGASSPLSSLFGGLTGGSQSQSSSSSPLTSLFGGGSSSSSSNTSMVSDLLSGLLGGGISDVSGLTSSNSGFFGRSIDIDSASQYLANNYFDTNALIWTRTADGVVMNLTEEQWAMVHDLELNVFFDDGEGYIDLGLDNVFDFTDDGALKGEYDGTWLAINDQPIAYYHTDTVYDGDLYSITGRVPVMLNGSRAELILVFDNENPDGYIAGVRSDYRDGETDTIAKGAEGLEIGDKIEFLCDYYSYDGDYQDSYYLGDEMIYDGTMNISNVYINSDKVSATYLFTDIYCQNYWTPVIPR